ncbi:hypothetical protein QBC44DRAFT_330846 [Cladorrhinum sp. PSN332]|nr:hypothetical protein QBC44DRAFT_330846 [Cladorrhinum sp. PSN332]
MFCIFLLIMYYYFLGTCTVHIKCGISPFFSSFFFSFFFFLSLSVNYPGKLTTCIMIYRD